ncbi:zinc-binding dehydrogenase [Kitasatospora acidiphila]|uniref:Zinc-binding dehydrogenase n=2 Tax=Kitasatospora acidiphila TaxID=2567942 RepID=A0A540W491_9ACTN|nr:zinc-binding dehydrogenase [Kitasatospora acidiphila]
MARDGSIPLPGPRVPGFEASGWITAVGPDVAAARVGEPVLALTAGGAFAETVVAPAALTLAVGELPLRTAAGFGWGTPTAYDLVNTVGAVRPGESVLIHSGAGAVGTLAAQFARLAGAGRIVGVVGSAAKAEYAAAFGCHRVLLREELPATDEQFDVILDPVGGATRRDGLRRLAPHGRLVAYGELGGAPAERVDATELLMSDHSLLTYNSNLRSRTHPARLADSARRALALLADGRIRVDITAEYGLAELDTAVERLRSGQAHGKSVLRVRS